MAITITMPANTAEIPAVLAKLREDLGAKQAEVNALRGAIEAVQRMCLHPNKSHGRDGYGDGSWSKCNTCGKVW